MNPSLEKVEQDQRGTRKVVRRNRESNQLQNRK